MSSKADIDLLELHGESQPGMGLGEQVLTGMKRSCH